MRCDECVVVCSRSLKRSVTAREPVKEQLEDLEDHRPFFTYWVTTVQILILFFSLFCYGFGPFGIDLHQESGLVSDINTFLNQKSEKTFLSLRKFKSFIILFYLNTLSAVKDWWDCMNQHFPIVRPRHSVPGINYSLETRSFCLLCKVF